MSRTFRMLIPSMTYTYSMMIGFVCLGICFICTLCIIISRIIYEREKRQRRKVKLHRLMINLPDLDVNEIKGNIFKEKDLPLDYGHIMTTLGKSLKDMDDFKRELQTLPMTIAEKLGKYTKTDEIEHLQRALVENQFHF